jgi:hypothetical protein
VGERREENGLTRERRGDFSPAGISKVQQHALLQRVKNLFAGYGYLLGGMCRGWGARDSWGSTDEFDEEPAILVRDDSMAIKAGLGRQYNDTLNRTIEPRTNEAASASRSSGNYCMAPRLGNGESAAADWAESGRRPQPLLRPISRSSVMFLHAELVGVIKGHYRKD